ncbi:hypothetical protein Tco_0505464 [Tanacetum coccineum]
MQKNYWYAFYASQLSSVSILHYSGSDFATAYLALVESAISALNYSGAVLGSYQVCSFMWKGFFCEAMGSWNKTIGQTLSWSHTHTIAFAGGGCEPETMRVSGKRGYSETVDLMLNLQQNDQSSSSNDLSDKKLHNSAKSNKDVIKPLAKVRDHQTARDRQIGIDGPLGRVIGTLHMKLTKNQYLNVIHSVIQAVHVFDLKYNRLLLTVSQRSAGLPTR